MCNGENREPSFFLYLAPIIMLVFTVFIEKNKKENKRRIREREKSYGNNITQGCDNFHYTAIVEKEDRKPGEKCSNRRNVKRARACYTETS